MKLIDALTRQPLPVAFGMARGGVFRITRDHDTISLIPPNAPEIEFPTATASAAGLLSAADKSRLDKLAQFGSQAEVESSSVDPAAEFLRAAGFASPGDGGDGLFRRVGAEPSHPGKLRSFDGAWWELTGVTVGLEQFGGGTDRTGAQNSAALSAAWGFLLAMGGGTMRLGAGTYSLNNTVLPDATARITVQGHGPHATMLSAAELGITGVSPADWMLTIGHGSTLQYVTLRGFRAHGTITNPLTHDNRGWVNGIRIYDSNHMLIDDVLITHFVGTGLETIRAHNSFINAKTVRCGSDTHSKFAQIHRGSDTFDETVNDLRFGPAATTEQDWLGIQIAYAANVWGGIIKLHGSDHTRRALEVHRVRNFDLKVAPTLGYTGNGMIYIGDSAGVAVPNWLPPAPPTGHEMNEGRLELLPLGNIQNHGVATDAVVQIDLGKAASQVQAVGLLTPMSYLTPDYKVVNLTGASAANVDLSALRTSETDQTKWVQDDRTVDKRYGALAFSQLSGIQLGIRDRHRGATAWQQNKSEAALYEIAPNTYGPQARLLGACFDNAAENTIFRGWQAHSFNIPSFPGAGFIVPPFTFPLWEDPEGATAKAIIRKVVIGGRGFATWDESNHWLLRFSRTGGSSENFYLSTDATFAVDGAGHPDRRVGGAANSALEYWSTPATVTSFTPTQILQIEAVQVGTRSAPSGLQITVFYDVVV